ncbi:MAG: hypothetical protein LBF74_07370 [Treponema sp.]|jgi:hypothetical protein|nr:hypothetical protein [Treponema sp.]
METKKLTVEIELSEEEAERFERFIEEGCYDKDKFLKRLLLERLNRKQELALITCKRKEVQKAV